MKKRLLLYCFAILLGLSAFFIKNYVINEKEPITISGPERMKDAFSNWLYFSSGFWKDYKIQITENANADICIGYGKEDDENYTQFAYTPFIVCISNDKKIKGKLEDLDVICQSTYSNDKNFLEIDFLKVINAVVNDEELMSNLTKINNENIKIFYPSRNSPYWQDFYSFLLVTINNGKYPESENDLKKADEIVKAFEKSNFTEEINDLRECLTRTEGFSKNTLYVYPEADILDAVFSDIWKCRILFPINTTYLNCYYKANSKLGCEVVSVFDSSRFYIYLSRCYYRSNLQPGFNRDFDYVVGDRDTFNVVDIPHVHKDGGLNSEYN